MPPTLAGKTPYWLVTTLLYTLLAVALGAATLTGLRRATTRPTTVDAG